MTLTASTQRKAAAPVDKGAETGVRRRGAAAISRRAERNQRDEAERILEARVVFRGESFPEGLQVLGIAPVSSIGWARTIEAAGCTFEEAAKSCHLVGFAELREPASERTHDNPERRRVGNDNFGQHAPAGLVQPQG